MTQRQLNKLVKTWAHRLGIDDWKITTLFKSEYEMGENEGLCYYYTEYRRAEIHILRECDREEGCDSIENTVVHELLHIVLEGHKPRLEGQYDAMFERGLNVIASVLIGER